jgi:hypothetical protein
VRYNAHAKLAVGKGDALYLIDASGGEYRDTFRALAK